jgi:hypothetical protein
VLTTAGTPGKNCRKHQKNSQNAFNIPFHNSLNNVAETYISKQITNSVKTQGWRKK